MTAHRIVVPGQTERAADPCCTASSAPSSSRGLRSSGTVRSIAHDEPQCRVSEPTRRAGRSPADRDRTASSPPAHPPAAPWTRCPCHPVADRCHGTIENLGVREPRRARRTARRARSARPSTPCSRRRSRVISTRNGPSASASTEPTRCTLTRTSVRSYSTAKAARPGPARRSEARRRVPTDRDELLPQPWKNRPGDRTGARARHMSPWRTLSDAGSASIRPAPRTACARWSAHWHRENDGGVRHCGGGWTSRRDPRGPQIRAEHLVPDPIRRHPPFDQRGADVAHKWQRAAREDLDVVG